VVKAQVLTGGRGKAGGVKLAATPDEVAGHAEAILGLDINGHVTRRLWVERQAQIAKEYYFSITFDRSAKRPLFMLSTMGGMDIEAVAGRPPRTSWPASTSTRRSASGPSSPTASSSQRASRGGAPAVAAIIEGCYRLFVESDAMLVEVNPLIVTPDGEVVAADAKVTIDDNALYRHPDIAAMRDTPRRPAGADGPGARRHVRQARRGDRHPRERRGPRHVDARRGRPGRRHAGELPRRRRRGAGGRDRGRARGHPLRPEAEGDPVQHLRRHHPGDEVARGILDALDRLEIGVPVVVRLDGTNAEEGRAMLAGAPHPQLHVEATMLDAARRAVALAGGPV
jgi:succinyl-CoA synthetase beta subunit